jgi:hypothetical protein
MNGTAECRRLLGSPTMIRVVPCLVASAALLLLASCSGVGPTEQVCSPRSLTGQRVGPATRDLEPCRASVGRWFDGADTDHDGKLTWSEVEADANALFERLDADHDGALTAMEVEAARGGGKMPRRGAGPGGRALASGLMAADTDLNFRVTRQELLTLVRRNFAGLDHDANGAVARADAVKLLAQVTKWKPEDAMNEIY